jgi:membrane-bound lytic murein transglycosylase F
MVGRTLWLSLVCSMIATPAAAAELELVKPGALRVVVVDGSPAFFSLAKGAPPGLDREILEGFAKLHGLQVSAVEAPNWASIVPWLLEGKGDVLAGGVTVTPGRSEKIDFTAEVMPTRMVLVSRRPHRVIETLAELAGERVGTVRGSSMAEELHGAGISCDDTILSGGTPAALRSGRITATLSGIEDALLYRRDDPQIQIGGFVGGAGSLAYGVRKDTPRLKRALDEYIANVRRTPTWARLLVKYFGVNAPKLLRQARGE